MDRCREMDFGKLREFIDHALERLPESGTYAELPSSREEFTALLEMLNAKLDAMRQAAPEQAGPPPRYDVPSVPYFFEPSVQLDSAYTKREYLRERLDEARFDPSSRRYVEQLESELHPLEREIAEREASEQQEHEKRRREEREASEQYYRRDRLWRAKVKREREWQEKIAFREQIVEKRRREIERRFGPGGSVPTEQVRWRLLPPGELSEGSVREYYARLQSRSPGTKYDPDRIVKALSLGPIQRYEEVGGVEGYTVFTFPHTSSVLLECPVVGNAIYLIHKDWERWSRMSKQELMADESGEVVRIVHGPGWFERVKRELGIETLPTA
jgi:hypothetical protein